MMRADDVAVAGVVALTIPSIGMHIPNEFVAEYVAAHPGRLFGFASVCPGVGDPVGELRHAVDELGFRALKLSPPYQGFHPHSPEAWEVFRAAAELDLVVMFHQGGVFTSSGALEYSSPLLLDKVAREFPRLRIIVAHMGQPFFSETVALMSKNPNVYADISARFSRPWQLHQMLLAAVEYRVADRVLFGTDFPVSMPRASIEVLRDLTRLNADRLPPLDDGMRESLVWDRPLRLLGLDAATHHDKPTPSARGAAE
jgi:predicted TIM-barrel fold metal-dependent hydrolase